MFNPCMLTSIGAIGGGEPPPPIVWPGFEEVSNATVTETSPDVWELEQDGYGYAKADGPIGDFLIKISHDGGTGFIVYVDADAVSQPPAEPHYIQVGNDGFGFVNMTGTTTNESIEDAANRVIWIHRVGTAITVKMNGASYAAGTEVGAETDSDLNFIWVELDNSPATGPVTIEFLPLP